MKTMKPTAAPLDGTEPGRVDIVRIAGDIYINGVKKAFAVDFSNPPSANPEFENIDWLIGWAKMGLMSKGHTVPHFEQKRTEDFEPRQAVAMFTVPPICREPGALLFFYEPSPSVGIPIRTYRDAERTTANTHPVIANSEGVFPPIHFESEAPFMMMLLSSDEQPIATWDHVTIATVNKGEF